MQVFQKKMFSEVLKECVMYMGGEDYCLHLFSECRLAVEIWIRQNIPGVDITYDVAVWNSLRGRIFQGGQNILGEEYFKGGRTGEGSLQCYGQAGCTIISLYPRGRWSYVGCGGFYFKLVWRGV